MNVAEFLKTVVTTPSGWFLLATRNYEEGWREHYYEWPNQLDSILQCAAEYANADVYFSAHLFDRQSSLKQYALPSKTVQADLDNAEIADLPVLPTVLVKTSPMRHQAFWVMSQTMLPSDLEDIARRVAYGIRECDRTGWPIGHRMRLPNTFNFKYMTPQAVEIAGIALQELDPEVFNNFPQLAIDVARATADLEWIAQEHTELDVGPRELLNAANVSAKIRSAYDHPARDRSAALWALMCEGFRVGLTREQVYWLAYNSPNNKFVERRYHGVRDLRQDILRAETVVATREIDVKTVILDLRAKKAISEAERRQKIASLVINKMRQDGELVHARGGRLLFLRKDTGRPISIGERSQWLNAYLTKTFGLNASEILHKFVVHEIMAYTRNMPDVTQLQYLSYYDAISNQLLLHTGGRDVLHVSADTIEAQPNGYAQIVFMFSDNNEPFKVSMEPLPDNQTWYDFLFRSSFEFVVGMSTDEAVCLMRAWYLFMLFRNIPTTRPILAFLGQPGSGKTLAIKRMYSLTYGRYKSITSITVPEDFDMATSRNPFVGFDNVDTWERWLPDRLALSASVTEVTRRVLYTNDDEFSMRKQALIALSAHNPKFTREDVVDRLLMFTLRRRSTFGDDSILLEQVLRYRAALWGGIVEDVQRVLATPRPSSDEAPEFRIKDFATLGLWFARAAGSEMEQLFIHALSRVQTGQSSFNLEENQLLVMTIEHWLKRRARDNKPPEFIDATRLHAQLAMACPEPELFARSFRSAQALAKKLFVLQESLKRVFDVEMLYDSRLGSRTWKLSLKE